MLEQADAVRSDKFDSFYKAARTVLACSFLQSKCDFDAACTRDNLGRLWDMKGDFSKSREWRAKGSEKMMCSLFDVNLSMIPVLFNHISFH
jgi:hypothetical protein